MQVLQNSSQHTQLVVSVTGQYFTKESEMKGDAQPAFSMLEGLGYKTPGFFFQNQDADFPLRRFRSLFQKALDSGKQRPRVPDRCFERALCEDPVMSLLVVADMQHVCLTSCPA